MTWKETALRDNNLIGGMRRDEVRLYLGELRLDYTLGRLL